ncbi:DUF302 domain-containing protein [Stappia stellulata]|uniref:DUF302 domain-containing protein n=1 Tax=Stappia stellulata TaxID=71235 RepID=UPI0004258959|nr:DUF302 domain-containing protein [Stappia stellulata]
MFTDIARALCLPALVLAVSVPSVAQAEVAPRDGWSVIETDKAFPDLVDSLTAAIKAAEMGLVTQASASAGAKMQGITIPGNRVIGVYRNDYARRMLEASVAAGIEAPIRFYVTEDTDGGATLSYKHPSFVFAPYMAKGGDALETLAGELDAVFETIAEDAVD